MTKDRWICEACSGATQDMCRGRREQELDIIMYGYINMDECEQYKGRYVDIQLSIE